MVRKIKDRTGHLYCRPCRCYRLEEQFINNGKQFKTCDKCRFFGRKYYKYEKIDRSGYIKCVRCACYRLVDDYKKAEDRLYKSCEKCRTASREHMRKKLNI